MGMYTKLFFDAEIRRNISDGDEQALQYLFAEGPVPDNLPNHPFFSKGRMSYMFNSPVYSGPGVIVKYGDYFRHICAHIEVKNYEGEIESFLDWVRPLLENDQGTCIGWTWYEESPNPNLIYA